MCLTRLSRSPLSALLPNAEQILRRADEELAIGDRDRGAGAFGAAHGDRREHFEAVARAADEDGALFIDDIPFSVRDRRRTADDGAIGKLALPMGFPGLRFEAGQRG